MSLSLPANFKNDIQGRDTALVPIVKIGDDIYVSTNSMTYNGNPVLPLLTSNPSLKESIDIEKRNYKISNISLTINNFPYEGQRFSDRVEGSLINTPVKVYWISPSTTTLDDTDTSGLKIYQGQVRRYDMTDTSCKITVEDRSQATLHKDLPTANLGTGTDVPDKYKNKPIPMVYGHVDKSPCIMINSEDTSQYIIKADDDDSVSLNKYPYWIIGSSQNLSYLYIYSDGQYSVALSDADPSGASIWNNHQVTIGQHTSFNYSDTIQYDKVDNTIVLYKNMRTSVDGFNQVGVNPIGLNHIVCHFRSQTVKVKQYGFNDEETVDGDWIGADDDESEQTVDIYYNEFYAYTPDEEWYAGAGEGWTDLQWMGSITPKEWHGWKMDFSFNAPPSSIDGQYYSYVKLAIKMYCQEASGFNSSNHLEAYIVTNNGDKTIQFPRDAADDATVPPTFDWLQRSSAIDWHGAVNQMSLTAHVKSSSSSDASTKIRIDTRPDDIEGIYTENIFVLDNFLDQEYYLDVDGREMLDGDSPTAPTAIKHILETELGQTGIGVTGTYDWKYAFTVDSKISSKKLLENIASASPYIPYYNNQGVFKFIEIPMNGNPVSPATVQTIKEADCIDFSFSRTKIEDVYTKIEFKHNWDYARGEFNDSVEADISLLTTVLDDGSVVEYDPTYYGFKVDGEYDHAESTLVIDDDRGKYIRNNNPDENGDDATAKAFAEWYLMWSCNQHLKMKIKLPLKYMNLEIGDFVDFDAILGGVKPYGINYIADDNGLYSEKVNLQDVFKNFLIISTNKTLEYVEIECIMMHNLDSGYISVSGCTDPLAVNYNGEATYNDGSCEYSEEVVNITDTRIDSVSYGTSSSSSIDVYPHNFTDGLYAINNLGLSTEHGSISIDTAEITLNEVIHNAEIVDSDNGVQTLSFINSVYTELFSIDDFVDGSLTYDYTFQLTTSEGFTYNHTFTMTYIYRDCVPLGDLNGDGGFNVLDIVTLANCVLDGDCSEIENGCAGDLNGDGGYNVLDIVTLANCVLAGDCGQ